MHEELLVGTAGLPSRPAQPDAAADESEGSVWPKTNECSSTASV